MRRKPWLLAGATLIAIAAFLAVRRYLPLATLITLESRLRVWVDSYPIRAFWIGLVAYTALSFVPGTTGKSLIFGWLFGFWLALLQVSTALTTAALGSFFLSRYFFRDAVQSRFGFYVTRFDKALCRSGASYVIALRLLHVPYTFVNYTLGATSIPWKTFLWATLLGMLPSNIVFVLTGAQLPSLATLSREGVHAVFSPTLMAAFILMASFPFVVQWTVRSWRRFRGIDTEDLTS